MTEVLRPYTTQLQAGLAMLQETRDLLRIYQPGQTASQLSEAALAQNVFTRMTARRAQNVVTEMFAPRYLAQAGQPAVLLQRLLRDGFYPDDFAQLCFLSTLRGHKLSLENLLPKCTGHWCAKVQERWNAARPKNSSGVASTTGACRNVGLLRLSCGFPVTF